MKTSLLFSSFPFITSDKVTLNRMTELDLQNLWAVLGDEENYRFSPTAALQSPNECAGKLRQAESLFRDRRAVVLGIYPNGSSQHLAGILEILDVDPEVEAASLTFTLSQRDQGQGYAAAAVRAVSDYLVRTIGVNRIQAYVLPTNYRAVLVLERCGFQKEGTIREGFKWPDKGIVDLTLYSLLASDLRPKKNNRGYYF